MLERTILAAGSLRVQEHGTGNRNKEQEPGTGNKNRNQETRTGTRNRNRKQMQEAEWARQGQKQGQTRPNRGQIGPNKAK